MTSSNFIDATFKYPKTNNINDVLSILKNLDFIIQTFRVKRQNE